MKAILLIIIVYLIINYGCDNSVEPVPQVEGTYQGTYSRTEYEGTDILFIEYPLIDFEFGNQTYRFYGEVQFLPTLVGAGKYSIDSRYITLVDTIPHTGNTEILKGEFSYIYNGINLILTQNKSERRLSYKFELTKKN